VVVVRVGARRRPYEDDDRARIHYGVETTCIGLTSHGTTVSVRKGQADVVKSLLQIVRFDLISNESKLD